MSGPTFLTDDYDQRRLDPRLLASRLSDQALDELWGPQVEHIIYHLMGHVEIRWNGWLRGTAMLPNFLTATDTVYLPRFARIIEQHLGRHPDAAGRKIRVMPIYEERGARGGYPNERFYMTEIPSPRTYEEVAIGTVSTVGEDIYSELLEIAERAIDYIISEGSYTYRLSGQWAGAFSLTSIDRSYREPPSFYTAMVGSLVEDMLKERANPALEHVACIGWDSSDTRFKTRHPGFVDTPWVAYRIHPVPAIIT